MARIFFRIVKSYPPTRADFSSNQSRGRRLENPTSERLRLWSGISVYETAHGARQTARKYPAIGRYIAELEIPDEGAFVFEKTLGPGHYTLWGSPDEVERCVVSITAVE
jgi:hypothetical protein